MSRRARARADARPWLQQRDDPDHIERVLEMVDDTDEHLRERAWEQYEAEQRQQPQGDAR
jgi:hypothetical protein